MAYLQGRLKRAGVEEALRTAGAEPGDDVEIAGAVFVYRPDDTDEGWDDDDTIDDHVDEGVDRRQDDRA